LEVKLAKGHLMDLVISMKENILSTLSAIIGMRHIALTPSGNAAILASLKAVKAYAEQRGIIKKAILVPEQGGWITYLQYPGRLRLDIVRVRTDAGVIDLEGFREKSSAALAILYANPAGYFAKQDASAIHEIGKRNGCMVIEDISGSVGKSPVAADIAVCSFGKDKPLNVHHGGCIATDSAGIYDAIEPIVTKAAKQCDEHQLGRLAQELAALEQKYRQWDEVREKIISDLEQKHYIIHKDKGGPNVIVRFSDETEKESIIKYCDEQGLPYTLCPRYIRVAEDAVSIEVKRLFQR